MRHVARRATLLVCLLPAHLGCNGKRRVRLGAVAEKRLISVDVLQASQLGARCIRDANTIADHSPLAPRGGYSMAVLPDTWTRGPEAA